MVNHVVCTILLLVAATAPVQAADRLTLRECINLALGNQPSIRAAQEGVNAGQGRVTQARSPYLPQIQASTGYSENHALGGALVDSSTKAYTTTLSVNQVLYDFGKTGNTLDSALMGVQSLEREADRIVQEVILNVKQAYYSLLASRQLFLVAQKTIEQSESHLKQAEVFFRSGSKPRYDVTRAEVEVNNAKLGMINARNNVRLRIIGLYTAIGLDPKENIETDDNFSAPVAIPLIEQALDEALRTRPEMLKAEADIASARSQVGSQKSLYWPTLSANGAYSWANGTSEMGPFKGDVQNSWNAGILMSMPLFEGGLTWGKVSEAQANLRALEAQKQTLRQSILLELNRAYADIESASARIAVMELSVRKARESLELAQGRYEAGVGPYIEVTDAQTASVNAETDHVQAQYDYQLAAARLYRAIGRVEK